MKRESEREIERERKKIYNVRNIWLKKHVERLIEKLCQSRVEEGESMRVSIGEGTR